MKRRALAAAGLAAALAGPGLAAGPEAAPTPSPWPEHYGNAPAELVPYRRATPYERFFTVPQPFLGPGREEMPRGLTSLRIGVLAPAPNGPDAARGAMMRHGIDLAVEEGLGHGETLHRPRHAGSPNRP